MSGFWRTVEFALPPRTKDASHIFLELAPARGTAELQTVRRIPPLPRGTRSEKVWIGPRGIAVELRDPSGAQVRVRQGDRFEVRLRYRGERPMLARTEALEGADFDDLAHSTWRDDDGLRPTHEEQQQPYPTLEDIGRERERQIRRALDQEDEGPTNLGCDRDSEDGLPAYPEELFFLDYDRETFDAPWAEWRWTTIEDRPRRLGDESKTERRDAIERLSMYLFAFVGGRLYAPRPVDDDEDASLTAAAHTIEELHLRLFRRHFRREGAAEGDADEFDVPAIGMAFGRFANLDLLRSQCIEKDGQYIEKDGAVSVYQNGVPNSFYFASTAELFSLLTRVGARKDLWKELLSYAVGSILVLARSFFAHAMSLTSYSLDCLATPNRSTRPPKLTEEQLRHAFQTRFVPLDPDALELKWTEVIQLAAPRSLYVTRRMCPSKEKSWADIHTELGIEHQYDLPGLRDEVHGHRVARVHETESAAVEHEVDGLERQRGERRIPSERHGPES